MTIGEENLLNEFHGNRVALAEALLDGTLEPYQQKWCDGLLSESIRWAAEIRWKEKQRIKETQKI